MRFRTDGPELVVDTLAVSVDRGPTLAEPTLREPTPDPPAFVVVDPPAAVEPPAFVPAGPSTTRVLRDDSLPWPEVGMYYRLEPLTDLSATDPSATDPSAADPSAADPSAAGAPAPGASAAAAPAPWTATAPAPVGSTPAVAAPAAEARLTRRRHHTHRRSRRQDRLAPWSAVHAPVMRWLGRATTHPMVVALAAGLALTGSLGVPLLLRS